MALSLRRKSCTRHTSCRPSRDPSQRGSRGSPLLLERNVHLGAHENGSEKKSTRPPSQADIYSLGYVRIRPTETRCPRKAATKRRPTDREASRVLPHETPHVGRATRPLRARKRREDLRTLHADTSLRTQTSRKRQRNRRREKRRPGNSLDLYRVSPGRAPVSRAGGCMSGVRERSPLFATKQWPEIEHSGSLP